MVTWCVGPSAVVGRETGRVGEFEALAVSVANGDGWLLESFGLLAPGTAGVVDIDFARHGVNA